MTTQARTGDGPAFTCPVPDGMFANPADSASFCHCSNNVPYLKHCPPHLHWSQPGRAANGPTSYEATHRARETVNVDLRC
ncbi:chitin binding peritrophin-A domain-containing protein [Streptomyces sp. NPDC048518]|uniref:chitin binding peritrophin-A domain-containing protein n=1 Tax=Streptomyces sp. NPDC048518 TaxID=3155029 RepID=UPI0033DF62C0